MNTQKININARIRTPIATSWERWTNPDHITQWNFATPAWHCPRATNELQPGGRYYARMEARDGSVGFDFEGVYDVVTDYQHLRYTLANGRQVDTRFAEADGATIISLSVDAESENPIDMQREGWQAILDNFKSYAENDHRHA